MSATTIKEHLKLPDFIKYNKYVHPQDLIKFNHRNIHGYKLPGIIDLHIHGAYGWDFSFGDIEKINNLLDKLMQKGITGVLATIITCNETQRIKALADLKKIIETRNKPPIVYGIYLEGPYLSPEKCGAHQPDLLKKPSIEEFYKWQKISGNNIKIITVAPELKGAINFIETISETGVICSLGHSNADAKTTLKAIKAGASHVTHLFNAMPRLHHRNPNLLSTVLAKQSLSIEIIADGKHISPDIIAFVANLYEYENISLISDSVALAGNPDGLYKIYNNSLTKKNKLCFMPDQTIFGSCAILTDSLKQLGNHPEINWGFIGTSIWQSPFKVLNIKFPDTEVLLDKEYNWVATKVKHTWYVSNR